MSQYSLSNKRIWITGASSGIGRSLAEALLKRGNHVVVSGRNTQALASLAEQDTQRCHVIGFDITEAEQHFNAVKKIKQTLGGLDMVIFNAGGCEYVDVKEFKASAVESMLKTNCLSMAYGVEAVLPLLRESEAPYMVAMSSTAAYGGLSRAEAYGASKAAVKNLFESLRIDLYRENIPVSIVCPGFVKTPLTDKNDFPMPCIISSEQAAEITLRGLEKYRREIHFPLRFSLMLKLLASLPGSLYTKLMAKTVR